MGSNLVPRADAIETTVPAFLIVLTVIAPVPSLKVTFPPALAKITPELLICTEPSPVVGFIDIPAPAIMEFTDPPDPGISSVTLLLKLVAVTPAPL